MRKSNIDTRRGVDVLKTLPQDKVIWQLPQNLIGPIEFGSTSAVAWIREDVALIKAASLNPTSIGRITLARNGTSLHYCLAETAASAPVLGGQGNSLDRLFSQEQLRMPAGNVRLPAWNNVKQTLCGIGIRHEQTFRVAQMAHQNASRNGNSWADYVKAYRIGVLQELERLGLLPNTGQMITCSFVEDVIMAGGFGNVPITSPTKWQLGEKVNPGGLCQQVAHAMNIIAGGPGVRVLNFPCQDRKKPCNEWHFVDVHGRQRGWGNNGDEIPKQCRLKNLDRLTLEGLFKIGGNVSGAALYYLWGQMGAGGGNFTFLAQDYSRGGVYRVLTDAFKDPSNRSRAIPIGAFYLYGRDCDPKKSLDSLVFLEILMRNSNPGKIIGAILDQIPVPYRGPWETNVQISVDGALTVSRKEV